VWGTAVDGLAMAKRPGGDDHRGGGRLGLAQDMLQDKDSLARRIQRHDHRGRCRGRDGFVGAAQADSWDVVKRMKRDDHKGCGRGTAGLHDEVGPEQDLLAKRLEQPYRKGPPMTLACVVPPTGSGPGGPPPPSSNEPGAPYGNSRGPSVPA
jgi:hypothetical protein